MAQANAGSGFRIVAREDYSDVTYMLEVAHPQMARAAQPGQFVIVMETEHGERIPLTIADFDRTRGTITLVIQAVGKTTREMQKQCQVGTSMYAVVDSSIISITPCFPFRSEIFQATRLNLAKGCT